MRLPGSRIDHVMSGFGQLGLHPNLTGGVTSLRTAGLRLVTLSNGAAQVADPRRHGRPGRRLRARAERGGRGDLEAAAGAYHHAAQMCATDPGDMVLVAVHPWDIGGAARAGMATAWLDRHHGHYPRYFNAPDHIVTDLGDLAAALGV